MRKIKVVVLLVRQIHYEHGSTKNATKVNNYYGRLGLFGVYRGLHN